MSMQTLTADQVLNEVIEGYSKLRIPGAQIEYDGDLILLEWSESCVRKI